MNVPVYFENEQLYSFDKEAELAISLHGAIAQGESENKSENIKWSLDKAAQNPEAQIYNRKCYGYSNAEDGSLVINESEAEVIRQVFQLYLDRYSVGGIKKYLEGNGILTSRGKTAWSKRSIETILTNEKYVGDVILYKTFSPDFPEKKRIQNMESIRNTSRKIITRLSSQERCSEPSGKCVRAEVTLSTMQMVR